MGRLTPLLFLLLWCLGTSAADLGVILIGDTGTGDQNQRDVAAGMERFCRGEACEIALLLGDNFYPNGVRSTEDRQFTDKFLTPYARLAFPFFVTFGNHDYDGGPRSIAAEIGFTEKSDKWRFPARYYYFTRENVEMYSIDTNRLDADQLRWLESRLRNSPAKWKIVFGHHPIRSYGSHGETATLVRDVLPILKDRADFYVCGHEHDQQVLRPVGAADGALNFVVAGSGGQTRPSRAGDRTLFHRGELGFAHFLFQGSKVRLRMMNAAGRVVYTRDYEK